MPPLWMEGDTCPSTCFPLGRIETGIRHIRSESLDPSLRTRRFLSL